jgi:hypothetical protein
LAILSSFSLQLGFDASCSARLEHQVSNERVRSHASDDKVAISTHEGESYVHPQEKIYDQPRSGSIIIVVVRCVGPKHACADARLVCAEHNPPGSKLEVKLKDGKTVKGKLSGVSDTALTLSAKDKPVDLKREDVASVYQVSKKSATKATLIGMGAGVGIGAVVGAVGDSQSTGFEKIDKAATAALTIIGAGAGALTGYLIGRSGHKRVLVYAARQP